MKSCDNIWKKKYPYPYLWWNPSKSIPVAMGTDIWQIWVRMIKYLPTGYPCQTLLVELISWGWYPGFKHFYREKWMIWQGCLRLVRVFLYIFRDTNLFSYSVSTATATTTMIMETMAGLEMQLKDQGDEGRGFEMPQMRLDDEDELLRCDAPGCCLTVSVLSRFGS